MNRPHADRRLPVLLLLLVGLIVGGGCTSDGTGPGNDGDGGDDPPNVSGAPSQLVAVPGDAGAIVLAWSDNSSAETGFEIQRSLQSGSGFSDIATTGANVTDYLDGSVEDETTYYYRVRLVSPGGASGYSNVASTRSLPAPNPSATLECEREGYPCTWSEVGRPIYDESDRLGDEMLEMLDQGGSTAEAATLLASMPAVADVEASDVAVRFRLRGGRPTWVLGSDALLLDDQPAADRPVRSVRPADAALGAHAVVGDEPKSKSALVLSVYQYQFGAWDEGAELAALLGATRSYEGNVVYLANTSQSQQVGPAQFKGWGSYDVIHVSTHGVQICASQGCKTTILAGTVDASSDLILNSTDPGVSLAKTTYGEQSYGVDTDFFRAQYPSGLPNTIVFMSACQTSKGSDLAQAIAGPGGAYLGWTETVWSSTAKRAAIAFFTNLIDKGIPANKAFQSLKQGGSDLTVDRPGTSGAVATLDIFTSGDDLRIREVVYLRNPLTEEELPTSFPYPVVGQPGDGQVDKIPFLIEVDGVDGNPAGFTVHVEINGFSGTPVPLAQGEAVDPNGNVWRVKGEVPVTFDAQQGQPVEIRARVDLPEGGTSEWDESPELGNPALRYTSMIESTGGMAPIVTVVSEVEAEFDLALDDKLEKLTGEDVLRYERFTVDVDASCSVTTTTVNGQLEVLDGDFVVAQGQPAVPSRLVLFIPPTISETVILNCGAAFSLPFIHYFAGFYSFHGGQMCGSANEADQALGGLVITGWTAGSGDVLAQKVYDRSCTEGEATFTEKTTIELVDPRGAG